MLPFRSFAQLLSFLLFASALANPASGQPPAPGPPVLAPEVRASLARVSDDPHLAPWQRDFVGRLARGSSVADPSIVGPGGVAPARADQPAGSSGGWMRVVTPGRYWHSAIYDPVRDRMVVFGGQEDTYTYSNEVWVLSLSGTPAWSRLLPVGSGPTRRCWHSAIYDPVRDRMVVFGGHDDVTYRDDVYALTLTGTPTWSQLVPPGSGPSGRYQHSATYDPIGDRMIVFGGWNGYTPNNEVWALSLAGTPDWYQVFPTGPAPGARYGHTAVYDSVRRRLVVFGGYESGTPRNDVYALTLSGTPAWSQLSPAGPPPATRYDHGAICDPVRDRMVVFGGYVGSSQVNDVWSLPFGTLAWSQLAPTGGPPAARRGHSALYDPRRDRMLAFGGNVAGGYLNDTWGLSLAGTPAWSQLGATDTPPSVRQGHATVHDALRDRMVVIGGLGSPLLNDVWVLSLAGTPAWAKLSPAGTPPAPRRDHSAIYDAARDRIVVFGGWGSLTTFFNDLWELSLAGTPTWTQLTPTGTPPSKRWRHTAVYDPEGDRMIVFAGTGGSSTYLNDVWELSLAGTPAWTQLAPTGTPPGGRLGHSAIYDPDGHRMVVFGGYMGSSAYANDVWALSLAGPPAWSQLVPTGGSPAARVNHSAIYDPVRDRMVVFGGTNGSQYFQDAVEFSLTGPPAWATLSPGWGLPVARQSHCAIYEPGLDRMIVFGGASNYTFNDTWELRWGPPLGVPGDGAALPACFDLAPPRPNPARSGVRFDFTVPRKARVSIVVCDVAGRIVRRVGEGWFEPGPHSVTWDRRIQDGAGAPAGVYFVRLETPGARVTRRMILLR